MAKFNPAWKTLYEAALNARQNAYAPYSGFRVGAAIMSADGRIYTGCNIENSSYGATCCAERVALFNAVSQGERRFTAIAVAGGGDKADEKCVPCGICLQALSEFLTSDALVIVEDPDKSAPVTLGQLLPQAFSLL